MNKERINHLKELAEELGMSHVGYAQVAPGMYVRNEDMGATYRHRR